MKSRIIVRVFGGLRNQLFINGAARRLALENNSERIPDDTSGFSHDDQYRRHYPLDHFNIHCRRAKATEHLEPFGRAGRYLKRRWYARRHFEQSSYFQLQGIDFDPRVLSLRAKGRLKVESLYAPSGMEPRWSSSSPNAMPISAGTTKHA